MTRICLAIVVLGLAGIAVARGPDPKILSIPFERWEPPTVQQEKQDYYARQGLYYDTNTAKVLPFSTTQPSR
jgi:hypothetical protein